MNTEASIELEKSVGVIILAAGTSSRMGKTDKILAELNGRPVISYCVEIFEKWKMAGTVVIVASDSNISKIKAIAAKRNWLKVTKIVLGGLRRQDSARNGLQVIGDCDWVVVHDAARPFVTIEMLERGLSLAQNTKCAVAAYPVIDTLKRSINEGVIESTLDRNDLYFAQTPQIFEQPLLIKAHAEINEDVTDCLLYTSPSPRD